MAICIYLAYFLFMVSFLTMKGESFMGNAYYYVAIVLFSLVHWIIAVTYFECACTHPFHRTTEANNSRRRKLDILFWTIIVIDFIGSAYSFFSDYPTVKYILFSVYAI